MCVKTKTKRLLKTKCQLIKRKNQLAKVQYVNKSL